MSAVESQPGPTVYQALDRLRRTRSATIRPGALLVLWAYEDRALSWSAWPVFVAALIAQFAVEVASIAAHEAIASRALVRAVLPHLVRAQIIDTALASAGLAVAFAAVENGVGSSSRFRLPGCSASSRASGACGSTTRSSCRQRTGAPRSCLVT